jgi:hypothetical protein
MRIAILYVALGRYELFWPEFVASCRRHFCPEEDRHWYVFTDSAAIAPASDLTLLHQDFLGWPFSSLYRYHMFRRIRDEIAGADQVVFFNANAVMLGPITPTEFFGEAASIQLVAGRHPGCHQPSGFVYPFESRPCSSAYVEHGCDYFQGCINAGRGEAFAHMVDELCMAIDSDLARGLVARWHDESHWNRYVLDLQARQPEAVHVLESNYLYPTDLDWPLPEPARILMRGKEAYGGHALLRQQPPPLPRTFLQKLKARFR